MKLGQDIAQIAALMGDPARVRMLLSLKSGKALSSTELAIEAGVGAATASTHLAKLNEAGLVQQAKQGRYRYWTLGSEAVGQALDMLSALTDGEPSDGAVRTGPKDPALRRARLCYDHLAGDYGVRLYDALLRKGVIEHEGDEVRLGPNGQVFLDELGVSVPQSRRPLCRACLDWSERRSHLGGQLGALILKRLVALGIARHNEDSRVITFSPAGEKAFKSLLGRPDNASDPVDL